MSILEFSTRPFIRFSSCKLLAALENVAGQYALALDAGIQKVIDEANKQLDEYFKSEQ
uniref:hypothetical protein n=1 Tax=Acetatifactor sp. TaxID=1872090 RepID=UPI0040575C4A